MSMLKVNLYSTFLQKKTLMHPSVVCTLVDDKLRQLLSVLAAAKLTAAVWWTALVENVIHNGY